jgi:ribosomal protein L37AE/L43A
MTRKCRDCMRRAAEGEWFCDQCLRAHLAAAYAASTPTWVRRSRDGLNRPKDLSGANR